MNGILLAPRAYGHHRGGVSGLGDWLVRSAVWRAVGRVVDALPFGLVVVGVVVAALVAVLGWMGRARARASR